MGAEKKGSKGRLLYLFDWHGKSRKKLFANKSDLSDGSNQENEYTDNSTAQYLLREAQVDENGSMAKRVGSFSISSSVNEDEASAARAPSVVARLMGLDSLPRSSASQTSSVVSHDPCTLGSSYCPVTPSGYHCKLNPTEYSYMDPRVDRIHWYAADSRSNTVQGRPFERFQTEVLPPKSAKPISITHHKLLSPIKSPGFIRKKDAAYIMEAASRIIESSPQSSMLTRTPSRGADSSPMRIRDLKEKMEAVNRSSSFPDTSTRSRQSPANLVRAISRDRSYEKPPTRTFMDSEVISFRNSTSKGRVAALSGRRRENGERKNGSTSDSRGNIMRNEKKQGNQKQCSTGDLSVQKSGHARTSTSKSTSVLKQNTEKQNFASNKDKTDMKAFVSDKQSRKSSETNGVGGSCREVNKFLVNSDNKSKVISTTVVNEKQPSLNRMKNIPRNKEFTVRDRKLEDSVDGSLANNRMERAKQHDFGPNACWDNKKKAMDVISFTFNSPIKRYGAAAFSSSDITSSSDRSDSHGISDESIAKDPSSPLLRLKLIGGDALSHLLEQKLKEIADRVEAAQSDSVKDSINDSASSQIESVSAINTARGSHVEHELLLKHDQDFPYPEACKREVPGVECCTSNVRGIDNESLNHSVSDHSFSVGSSICSSSKHDHNGGKLQSLWHQSEEDISCTSTDRFHPVENERDISDTASSSYDEWDSKHTLASRSVSDCYPTYWKLHYVRQIVLFAGLKEFVLDENMTMDSSVFDLVENQIILSTRDAYETTKHARELLFDCVNDCLCQRYENISVGSFKAWDRWRIVLQREDWLAEDLYKEILGLENMRNLMLDELVEKDMGIQYGGWLDFETETLEEGMDIGTDLVDSMIEELVIDLCMI